MSFENGDFNEWDENFLEQAIRAEEEIISKSSRNPTQQRLHHQQPPPFVAVPSIISFSPPRVLSQKRIPDEKISTKSTNGNAEIIEIEEEETEIDRLKKELGRVSEQLSNLEQECVELKNDRDKKEEQLKSVLSKIEAKDDETYCLKNSRVEYEAVIQDHPTISQQVQNTSTSIDQAGHGLSITSDFRRRILIDSGLTTSNECSIQKIVLPETTAQPKCTKAVGVQTDTSGDYSTIKNDLCSQHDLSKKLLAIWGSPSGQLSGRDLLSKLLVTCATDFYVLFRCLSMSMPSKTTLDSLADESFSNVALHDHMQSVQSVESAKVSHLYLMLTKISSETVQLDTLFEALLDLCVLENVVIVHRSLCIVRVILQHMLSLETRSDRRDNVTITEIFPKNNTVEFCKSEKTHPGVNFGVIRNGTCFLGDFSSRMRSFDMEILHNKEHGNPGNVTSASSLDWVSLFEMMHRIAMGNTEECIRVEALSIMNLILTRSNPGLERARFGQMLLFECVSRLLRKEAGLCVQKQAVRLLFLLLNYDMEIAGAAADGAKHASAFRGFSSVLEGLAECVECRGNGTQELKLRRHAIIVLAFVASSGKSGFEVLLDLGISKGFNFLELIIRVLESEMDAEAAELAEPSEICKDRTSLMREALILLNRLASNPVYSTAVLRVLTGSRELASLTVDVANRMSRKGRGCQKSGNTKAAKMKAEIIDLARAFRSRVFTYLGDNIS